MVLYKNILRVSALIVTIICSNNYAREVITPTKAQAPASAPEAQELQRILQAIKNEYKGIALHGEIQALGNKERTFNQAELLEMCEIAMRKIRGDDEIMATEHYEQLNGMLHTLIAQLKDYKVSGFGFSRHFSFNIFYGKENFNFDLVFKNNAGEILTQGFNLRYSSLGWQSELAYRLDAIFVVNSNLSSYDVRTPLEFKTGFSCGWRLPFTGPKRELTAAQQEEFVREFIGYRPFRMEFTDQTLTYPLAVSGVTVLPFKTMEGALVIAHLGIGLTGWQACNGMFSINAFNLAAIKSGGTLTPKAG